MSVDSPTSETMMQTSTTQEKMAESIRSVNILGVRVHNVSLHETMKQLKSMALSDRPHQVVTVNPEFIMTAQQNNPFRNILNAAALSLPDGMGIVWASRWLGEPMTERVTGVDTVRTFAKVAQLNNLRVFMLGAATGIAEQAAKKLQEENPGLQIVGTHAGSPDACEEDEICRRVKNANPHVLLVAYGSPNQELWINRNMHRLNVPVMVGVGGTFDFIAGIAKRAPRWMQRCGLEWFHRLMREPHRWRRMLALPRYAFAVLLSGLKHHQ